MHHQKFRTAAHAKTQNAVSGLFLSSVLAVAALFTGLGFFAQSLAP